MKVTEKKYHADLLTLHPQVSVLLETDHVAMVDIDTHWHADIDAHTLAILLASFPFHVVRRDTNRYFWLNPSPASQLLLSHPAIHQQKLMLIEHNAECPHTLATTIVSLMQQIPALEKRNSIGFAQRSDARYHALKQFASLGWSVSPYKKKHIAALVGCSPSNLRKGA